MAVKKESMVGTGLRIEECPSKQMAMGTIDSDLEDLPYPHEEEGDNSDDLALRDKHETTE